MQHCVVSADFVDFPVTPLTGATMLLRPGKDKRLIILSLAAALVSHNLHAATSSKEISWMFLIFGLLGGLALFLYGMELMSAGMKKKAESADCGHA